MRDKKNSIMDDGVIATNNTAMLTGFYVRLRTDISKGMLLSNESARRITEIASNAPVRLDVYRQLDG